MLSSEPLPTPPRVVGRVRRACPGMDLPSPGNRIADVPATTYFDSFQHLAETTECSGVFSINNLNP